MATENSGRAGLFGWAALALAGGLAAAGGAAAQVPDGVVVQEVRADGKAAGQCPDGGARPKACTKEIRIWNNTAGTIYPLLQASKQDSDAMNCPKTGPGKGGDVWLQRALGDTSKCYAVTRDYYAYVNPANGIPAGGFASISVPWWSKRAPGGPDVYIDWWRAGRLMIFDDKVALNDSYAQLKGRPQVKLAAGSPAVACNAAIDKLGGVANACKVLQVFEATEKATIGTQTPFQLNEFTFASVDKVRDNGKAGGEFRNFNQNYNVSNVDQVYLPVAMGPVRQPADVGYMGSVTSVPVFRKQMEKFANVTGKDADLVWPVYNNPKVGGKPMYPDAGVRIPSTQTVLNFYMNPFDFAGGKGIKQIVPAKPPKLVADLMAQWQDCTAASPKNCPDAKIYKQVNAVFLQNYKGYIGRCPNVPAFMKPVQSNPPMPKLTAYLTAIYGWVPYEIACSGTPLPTIDQLPAGSRVPIDYMHVQYNYEWNKGATRRWFNPYTQLIHADAKAGGLDANAYAFSIDDHSSFLSNSGGTTPGGLIFAVGGSKGLLNKTQQPPPTPAFYKYFDFVVALAPPDKGAPQWAKYGICKETADVDFPGSGNGGYAIGIDPALVTITPAKPCIITFVDSRKQKYQFRILQAKAPPQRIWPAFKPNGQRTFDNAVMRCVSGAGVVPPARWCNFVNQLADPTQSPGIYSISTRGPVMPAK